MKQSNLILRLCVVFIFSVISGRMFAQTLPALDYIKLEKPEDYRKAEPYVIQTANYILSIPFKAENPERKKGMEFIVKWVQGTTDHSFRVDETADRIRKGNEDAMGIYLAAMAKYVIEHKDAAEHPEQVELYTVNQLIDYCLNPDHKMPMSKYLKKLKEARDQGTLEKELTQ